MFDKNNSIYSLLKVRTDLLKLSPVVRETGGDTNLVKNKKIVTQNLVGKKNQFAAAAAAANMKINKPPPAAIIKINKTQPCAGFN